MFYKNLALNHERKVLLLDKKRYLLKMWWNIINIIIDENTNLIHEGYSLPDIHSSSFWAIFQSLIGSAINYYVNILSKFYFKNCVCVHLVTQLCLTLYDSMHCSPTGSSGHGNSLGKNTGMGSHAFFQGIFPTQGLNPVLPHCRRILYCLSHKGSPRLYTHADNFLGICRFLLVFI